MKILHTADWHLGDRLGYIDRTDDIRRAVEQVAEYCLQHQVEVLIVAGDLFSEQSRADGLRDSLGHLQRTFHPFLAGGGTIVALAGNHDSDTFCQTLHHAMSLAAPPGRPGELMQRGRLYLGTSPTFFRLADAAGEQVQFVLMPYPTRSRYLNNGDGPRLREEINNALQAGFTERLQQIRQDPAFDPKQRSVLVAHITVQGSVMPNLFRISEQEDVILSASELPTAWDYVALGHIHRPQCLMHLGHIRYSGSIERLDMGEHDDHKSVVLLEMSQDGLHGEPELLPLDATPFYEVQIDNLREDLPRLQQQYPDAERALVRCQVVYRAGTDDLQDIHQRVHEAFPRCYHFHPVETGLDPSPGALAEPSPAQSLRETVLDYLQTVLADNQPEEREAVVQLLDRLLLEETT